MKKTKLKHCLAVSTVVANMLMILITLSLAAILVAWAGTTYGAFSGGSSIFFQQRGQALQERFVIENVYFDKYMSPPVIRVFVRNVGAEETIMVALYVNGGTPLPTATTTATATATGPLTTSTIVGNFPYMTVTQYTAGTTFTSATATTTLTSTGMTVVDILGPTYSIPVLLPVGQVCEFRFTYTWTSGQVFTFVIATLRGGQFTYTASAP
jgi:FlaG/FlaF family flagellin (archaellin)